MTRIVSDLVVLLALARLAEKSSHSNTNAKAIAVLNMTIVNGTESKAACSATSCISAMPLWSADLYIPARNLDLVGIADL